MLKDLPKEFYRLKFSLSTSRTPGFSRNGNSRRRLETGDVRRALIKLFKILDTRIEKRDERTPQIDQKAKIKQKAKIERTAQRILDARTLYPESSLADLYDELHMPQELLKDARKTIAPSWRSTASTRKNDRKRLRRGADQTLPAPRVEELSQIKVKLREIKPIQNFAIASKGRIW